MLSILRARTKNLRISLLDHYDTTEEKLDASGHKTGPGCRCGECECLKNMEDKWITRIGSYHSPLGLNEQDKITKKARTTY